MSIGQLRYRRYGISELLTLFAADTVMLSRRQSFTVGSVDRADRISAVMVSPAGDAVEYAGDVLIKATLFTHLESITPLLLADGFADRPVEDGIALVREWRMSVAGCRDSLAFLTQLVKAVDEVADGLPLMFYYSREWRIVLDYLEVMRLTTSVVSLRKMSMEFQDSAGLQVEGQSQIILVSRNANGEWLACLPGDEFAPAFPSQALAVAFAERRLRLLAPSISARIKLYQPPAQRIYKLVDSKTSLSERISWLKGESARLERLLPACDTALERAR